MDTISEDPTYDAKRAAKEAEAKRIAEMDRNLFPANDRVVRKYFQVSCSARGLSKVYFWIPKMNLNRFGTTLLSRGHSW